MLHTFTRPAVSINSPFGSYRLQVAGSQISLWKEGRKVQANRLRSDMAWSDQLRKIASKLQKAHGCGCPLEELPGALVVEFEEPPGPPPPPTLEFPTIELEALDVTDPGVIEDRLFDDIEKDNRRSPGQDFQAAQPILDEDQEDQGLTERDMSMMLHGDWLDRDDPGPEGVPLQHMIGSEDPSLVVLDLDRPL